MALATARPAENEYEYEDEPAPAPKKPVGRPLIGRRNPLASKNNKATSTTTTTTTEAPAQVSLVIFKLGLGLTAWLLTNLQEEVEEPAEGDYVDEQQPETSSTTESSKKFLKSGVVRPFRSNDDLLATLKRRREQVVGREYPITFLCIVRTNPKKKKS